MVDIKDTIDELTAGVERIGPREARIIAHVQAQATMYNSDFLTEGRFHKRLRNAKTQLEAGD